MNLTQADALGQKALVYGTIFVAVLCLAGAGVQIRTGRTHGLSGKGLVLREDEPAYFFFMFYARLVLGIAGLAAVLVFYF